ncbi:hypothetical protein [Dichelobacter nodosus]|nr:hypothetical protein [Dichelobacter nodosus]
MAIIFWVWNDACSYQLRLKGQMLNGLSALAVLLPVHIVMLIIFHYQR